MAVGVVVEFPQVEPGEEIVVSATTFVTFERCPEQAAGRLRGIYPAESRASFLGGLAHRIFARHLTEGPIPGDRFLAACREEIGEHMNPKLSSLGLKPSQLDGVIGEVAELYERFKLLGAEGFEGAHVPLEVAPAEGVTLKGELDAVFDGGPSGVRLVDWKTGSLAGAQAQLAFYALLWALERGEIPGSVEAVSVGTGERLSEVPTDAGVQATADRVGQMVSVLRRSWVEGVPLARLAGPWCRWCPLLEDCDEGRTATRILAD